MSSWGETRPNDQSVVDLFNQARRAHPHDPDARREAHRALMRLRAAVSAPVTWEPSSPQVWDGDWSPDLAGGMTIAELLDMHADWGPPPRFDDELPEERYLARRREALERIRLRAAEGFLESERGDTVGLCLAASIGCCLFDGLVKTGDEYVEHEGRFMHEECAHATWEWLRPLVDAMTRAFRQIGESLVGWFGELSKAINGLAGLFGTAKPVDPGPPPGPPPGATWRRPHNPPHRRPGRGRTR